MGKMYQKIKELTIALHRIGSINFGEFKLKSGVTSPIYLDLRLLISHPRLLRETAELMWEKVEKLSFNCVCGVPYTALPIATALSIGHNIPMVMRRKEAKDYGLKRMIEGHFTAGDTCLVVEDLVTTGSSVFETITPLADVGLKVSDVIIVIDREQGGKENIESKGYRLHSLLKLSEMLEILRQEEKISPSVFNQVNQFLNSAK